MKMFLTRMREYAKAYLCKNDNLMKDTVIIFIGSMLGNVFNYAYQLFVARSLGPDDYGIFGSLFALVYIVMLGAGVLSVVVTKYAAEYYARNEFGRIRTLFTRLSLGLLVFSLAGFVIISSISRHIADFLNIESVFLVILVGIFGLSSLFMPVYDGILGGLQRFRLRSFLMVLSPLFKMVFFAMFVALGYKLKGAFFAIILAQILATICYILPNLSLLKYERQEVDNKDILRFIVPTVVGTVLPMFLINFDIILVKHYMTSAEAGFYSAASMLGKIIFFGVASFAVTMFPKISRLHASGHKSGPLLKATLAYTALATFCAIIVYCTVPGFIIGMLYGTEYEIEQLVGLFAIAITLFSLNNVLIWYNLAQERFGFGYFIVAVAIIEIAGIVFLHNALADIVMILIVSFALLFVCLSIYTRTDMGITVPYASLSPELIAECEDRN